LEKPGATSQKPDERMKTVAPAKINWTLEVLGRRDDGYHEIRSVMQTIDLCDEVWAERSDEARFETTAGKALPEDDLIVRATRALEKRIGRPLTARIRVQKRIPLASGLGGGSSDAAAVLRLLSQLHELGLSNEDLAAAGAEVGSDVPFFVVGGTALAEGRGEKVTPLPEVSPAWVVLLVPPNAPREKTASMYANLDMGDFSDGSSTDMAVVALRDRKFIDDWAIKNVFERLAYECFHDLAAYRLSLLTAGARAAYLAGSGPSLFAVSKNREDARKIASSVKAGGGKLVLAKTIRSEQATAITD
jgi:4-diphosphocytidyl-2-C-methyl-D-erythritol kinase